MGNVHHLHMVESGLVDFAVVAELQKSLGIDRYHELADEIIFELTYKISRFSKAAVLNDGQKVSQIASEIRAIAAKIGMSSVIDVTTAALEASSRGDTTALGALNARLVRIAEGSLFLLVQIDEQAP